MFLVSYTQEKVLNEINDGGSLRSFYENGEYRTSLSDKYGNDLKVRSTTILKLKQLKLIQEKFDCPALNVDTWFLTKLGSEYLKLIS